MNDAKDDPASANESSETLEVSEADEAGGAALPMTVGASEEGPASDWRRGTQVDSAASISALVGRDEMLRTVEAVRRVAGPTWAHGELLASLAEPPTARILRDFSETYARLGLASQRSVLGDTSRLVETVQRSFGASGLFEMQAKYARMFESDTFGKTFTQAYLSNIASVLDGLDVSKSVIGGLHANTRIAESVQSLVAGVDVDLFSSVGTLHHNWASGLLGQAETREWMLLAATQAAPERRLLSARPLAAFDRYLTRALTKDSREDDETGAGIIVGPSTRAGGLAHGYTTHALAVGDALLSPLDEDDRDAVVEVVHTELVEPWVRARSQVGDDLVAQLAELDPKLAEMLKGAWHNLDSRGPGYLEAAAHLGLEAVSRTIRHLAPDTAVTAWIEFAKIPAQGL